MSRRMFATGSLLLALVTTALGSGQTCLGAQKEKKKPSRLELLNQVHRAASWRLSQNVSMLALLRARKAPQKIVDKYQRDVDRLSKALKIKVPKMRPLTGNRIKDMAYALGYLLREGGPDIGRGLRKFGSEHPFICELAIKSSILTLIYTGDPNDKTVKAACSAVERSAKRSTIPERLWNPIVQAGGRKMASNEFNRILLTAHSAIDKHLKRQADAAIADLRR